MSIFVQSFGRDPRLEGTSAAAFCLVALVCARGEGSGGRSDSPVPWKIGKYGCFESVPSGRDDLRERSAQVWVTFAASSQRQTHPQAVVRLLQQHGM